MSKTPNAKLQRWADLITEQEIQAYAKAGFGEKIGIGSRPALLNIDTTNNFVDPKYDMCAERDERLINNLVKVTEAFRDLKLPIFYSRRDDRSHPTKRGVWNLKLGTANTYQYTSDPNADQWPEAYRPREQDVIVLKNKPSPFFATPLESWLRYEDIDSIIIVGISTSGCVRAGALDAFNHNFRVTVIEDCCGDRSRQVHRANMFDMDMKMADVEPLDAVLMELQSRFGN
ncbi:MAG: isochorismatase family protein [Alphaproteobacteria bacterium]|jgi:nicotinamidase-related amidase